MAFTYTGALDTDLDKLRFEIGDTVSGTGVLPDGNNIPDATLNALLTSEGSVGLAAAKCCEVLARHWTRVANIQVGQRREDLGAIAAQWTAQAEKLRKEYGGGNAGGFSVTMQRDDAYHLYNEFDDDAEDEYSNRTIYIRL